MTWKQAFALCVMCIASAIAGGAVVVVWVRSHFDAIVHIPQESVHAHLVGPVEVSADLLGNIDVALDTTVTTEVPVSQHFRVPIDQTISADATIDSDVPVKATFHFKQSVPLDTKIYVNTVVKTPVLGAPVDVPVQATIPIHTSVPVDVIIPIDQTIRMKFTVPVKAHVNQVFDVPVSVRVSASVPVKTHVQMPALAGVKARVNMPEKALEATVDPMEFRVPLTGVDVIRSKSP
jgi:hypothetical protein